MLAAIVLALAGLQVIVRIGTLLADVGPDIEEVVITVIAGLLVMGVYAIVLLGAIKMKRLESYALAVTASILAMMPCSGCCIIGLPLGIWALVVLCDHNVRSAFR